MKKVIFTLSCMLIATTVFSQWFAEVSGEMVLPMRTENDFLYYNRVSLYDEINDEYYENRKESIKFNVIQSPALKLKGGYLLNDKFTFALELSYANNGLFKSVNKNNKTIRTSILRANDIETIQTDTKNYYSRVLSVAPYVAYNFNLCDNFSIHPLIQVDFSSINVKRVDRIKTERFYYVTGEKFEESIMIDKNEFPFSYSFENLINFSTGINILYDINENISLSLNGIIDLFKKQYTPDTQIKYYQETIIDGETIAIDKNEYVYDLQGLRELFFVNRYRISLGLRYTFGSTKKNGNDG